MQAKLYRILGILAVITVLLLIVLSAWHNQSSKNEEVVPINSPALTTSLWLVDWAYEQSAAEALEAMDHIDQMMLFAVYFNEAGELYQIDSAKQMITKVIGDPIVAEKKIYLTIVNDQFSNNGTVIQKNSELITAILSSSASRKAHINEIVQLAKQYPIDGIELDYENVPPHLAREYLDFAQQLQQTLEELGLSLRVVLEPKFPIKGNQLPTDLQYVVMAYNLHGYHSGPGPKADYAFLNTLAKQYPNHSGNIGMAFATGGFSWQEGTVKSLTNAEIEKLVRQYKPSPVRDDRSGALSFVYQEEGRKIEVWYADKTTLALWAEHAVRAGYTDFSLWRAGGLTKQTLKLFYELKHR